MIRKRVSAILVAATVGCCAAVAPAYGEGLGEKWAADLLRAERLLVAGEYGEARRITRKIADQMVDALGPGDTAARALGLVLAYRGLAEAGAGDREAALWYWHVALNLDPGAADLNFRPFGEPGEFLRAHPLRPLLPSVDPCSDRAEPAPCSLGGRVVEPPKVRKRPRPKYPQGARLFRETGALIVSVVIGEDGSVSQPRIVQPLAAPTLSFVALEAVRQWEFEPAKLGGEPVAVYYQLTVNFTLRK